MPETTEPQNPTPAGATGATPDTGTADAGAPTSRREIARRFIRAKSNDAERAVLLLQKDLERAEGEVADLKRRPAAPAGAVVLTGDDATAYAAYRALGAPADLKTRLAAADADAQFRAKSLGDAAITKVAEQTGYKAKPLIRLARDLPPGARLDAREVEVDEDGEKVKRQVAHVVTGTGDALKAEPLDAYGAREIDDWADFLPALRGHAEGDAPGADRSPTGRASSGAPDPADAGARFPDQRERGAPGTADPLKALRASRTSPSKWAAGAKA